MRNEQNEILGLLRLFRAGKISADEFAAEFTGLWILYQAKFKEEKEIFITPQRVDVYVEWQEQRLSSTEFASEWAKLGLDPGQAFFHTLIDSVHTLCAIYYPEPDEDDFEIGPGKLARLASEALEEYEQRIQML